MIYIIRDIKELRYVVRVEYQDFAVIESDNIINARLFESRRDVEWMCGMLNFLYGDDFDILMFGGIDEILCQNAAH